MSTADGRHPSQRCIAVTGAGSGIGKATALAVGATGATVGLIDRDRSALETVERELADMGASCVAVQCDLTDAAAVARAFDPLMSDGRALSGLVCSAGIERHALTHDTSDELWASVLATNLTGAFLCCREALRHFLIDRVANRSIVCVSSPLGVRAMPGATAYCVSKAGVLALVRGIALEYGNEGIRANAVLPGATETPLMWSNVAPDRVDETRTALQGEIALGRLAQPTDIARTITWLLSEDAAYVTGAEIACDGGISAKVAISA